MHAFILRSIGPLGSDQNSVVWPWNVAMVALVAIVFWGAPDAFGDLRRGAGAWSPGPRRLALVVALLIGVLPALSFAGRWDAYLSASLYSGSNLQAAVFASPLAAERFPPEARSHLEAGPDGPILSLYDWSMGELNVPPYPARRVLLGAIRPLCDAACPRAGARDLVLALGERPNRLTAERRFTRYPCSALR